MKKLFNRNLNTPCNTKPKPNKTYIHNKQFDILHRSLYLSIDVHVNINIFVALLCEITHIEMLHIYLN